MIRKRSVTVLHFLHYSCTSYFFIEVYSVCTVGYVLLVLRRIALLYHSHTHTRSGFYTFLQV
jgi:hypothetical protein